MRDIGKNIRDLRESKDLTQEELAARLFVTRQTVSNYETGKTRPDVDMILRMAEVLDADANTVFYGRPIDGDRRRRIITAVSLIAVTAVLWLLELYLRRELTEYKQSTFIIWPLATEELIFKTTVRIMFGYSIVNTALLAFKGKPLVTRWTHIVKIAAIVLTAAAYIGSLLAVLACVIDIHENYFIWTYAKTFYYLNTYYPWVYVVLGAALAGASLKKPENAEQGRVSCKPN